MLNCLSEKDEKGPYLFRSPSHRTPAYWQLPWGFAELGKTDEALRDLKTAIAFSNVEVESFMNLFGNNRTFFDKYMALLEGERGPLSIVLNQEELDKAQKWIH